MHRLAALALGLAAAYDNGTPLQAPPLGWQTWCAVGPCSTDLCFDFQIRETAQKLHDSGLAALGYKWIVLDDCWQPQRDPTSGELVPWTELFPDGMKPVADFVHSLGLKFGLYTSVGTSTCVHKRPHTSITPGSYGHFDLDAKTFASWGLDYIKLDYCGHEDSEAGHRAFSKALNATGHPMALELCRGPYQTMDHWGYAPEIAQVWRAGGDHHDNWDSVLYQSKQLAGKAAWSGPFGWAYGDMLMTGGEGCGSKDMRDGWDPKVPKHCPKMTDNEYRSEFTLYAIQGSPMVVGTDIREMTPIMEELMFNKEVLEINQDYKSPGGDVVAKTCGGDQTYLRKMSDGRFAVAVLNTESTARTITICVEDFGWAATEAAVRDVWGKADASTKGGKFSKQVGAHDTILVVLSHTAEFFA